MIIKSLLIIVTAVIFYGLGFFYGRINGYNVAMIEKICKKSSVEIFSSKEEALGEQKKYVKEQINKLKQELKEIEELERE